MRHWGSAGDERPSPPSALSLMFSKQKKTILWSVHLGIIENNDNF